MSFRHCTKAAEDKYLLESIMLHKTGHTYSNMLFLPYMKINVLGYNDTTEHLALGFLDYDLANINNLNFRPRTYFTSPATLKDVLEQLNKTQLDFFNRTYRLHQPIFNRKITFP